MIAPGATFGSLTVAALDSTGKRATCLCSCGTVRQVAVDALLDGSSQGCGGCRPLPRSSPVTPKRSPFAAELVAAERQGARGRHRGRI